MHQFKEVVNAVAKLSAARNTGYNEWFGDRVSDRHPWIQRGERILEHHLKPTTYSAKCRTSQVTYPAAAKVHLALDGFDDLEDCPTERALSAARFAHESERLSFLDGERNAVDRPNCAYLPLEETRSNGEVNPQVIDFKQRRWVRG